MIRRVLIAGVPAAAAVWAQIPQALKPPAGEVLVLSAHAKGDQIYVCRGASWTLEAPDAKLFDESGAAIARHFAGPTWESRDGSQVKGKLVASEASPDSAAVPWLLLTAVGHSGSGVLANVTTIQRLRTRNGKAPGTGCDAAHEGSTTRSPYEADYNFYAPAQK